MIQDERGEEAGRGLPGSTLRQIVEVLGLSQTAVVEALGNAWCDGKASPAMRVPSAVSAGEFSLLLNARHPAWRWSWITAPVPFAFDARLRDLVGTARRGR